MFETGAGVFRRNRMPCPFCTTPNAASNIRVLESYHVEAVIIAPIFKKGHTIRGRLELLGFLV
jgi:hypothetical protein